MASLGNSQVRYGGGAPPYTLRAGEFGYDNTGHVLYIGDGTINVRVAWVHRGTYGAGTAYVLYDLTVYDGGLYLCIQAGTGQTPSSAPTYWTLLARQTAVDSDFTKSFLLMGG